MIEPMIAFINCAQLIRYLVLVDTGVYLAKHIFESHLGHSSAHQDLFSCPRLEHCDRLFV
jgi:hypothetical protein